MPGIDTLRTMRELRPDVQIILLIERSTVKKGIEAMKLGVTDFIEKPIEKTREAKSMSDEIARQKTEQIIDDILKTKGW